MTTQSRLPGPDLSSDSNSGVIRSTTHRQACHFSPMASPTRRLMGPLSTPMLHLQLHRPLISLHVTLLLYFGAEKFHMFPFCSLATGSKAFLSPESSPFYVFQHSTTHSGPWELFVTSGSIGLLIWSIFC